MVRSLRNGASAVYQLEGEDLREHSGWAVALDAALSFGESMGFLFDDEMLVDRRPETLRRALARLHEILAPPDFADDDAFAVSAPTLRSGRAVGDPARGRARSRGARGPMRAAPKRTGSLETAPVVSPLLSKFRTPPAPAPAESVPEESLPETAAPSLTARSGATLGRVRPVRLRAPVPDAPAKVDPLVRLLADF